MKLVRFALHVPGAWSEENMVPDEHGDWVDYHSVSARIAELEQERDAAKARHSDLAETVVRPAQKRITELETALTQAANVMTAASGYMHGKQAEFLLKSANVANRALKGSK